MSTVKQGIIYCSVAAVLGIVATVYPNDLEVSPEGLKLIAGYENCTTNAYKDTVGVCTMGLGTTRDFDGKPVTLGSKVTDQEAAALFVRDVKEAEQCVFKYLNGAKMPQPVLDSVVSLVYNNGCYGTRWNAKANRPTFITRYSVSEDWEGVCYRIGDFINAGGKPSNGLINRRKAEQQHCITYRGTVYGVR